MSRYVKLARWHDHTNRQRLLEIRAHEASAAVVICRPLSGASLPRMIPVLPKDPCCFIAKTGVYGSHVHSHSHQSSIINHQSSSSSSSSSSPSSSIINRQSSIINHQSSSLSSSSSSSIINHQSSITNHQSSITNHHHHHHHNHHHRHHQWW